MVPPLTPSFTEGVGVLTFHMPATATAEAIVFVFVWLPPG
jgi:hypothetical protein